MWDFIIVGAGTAGCVLADRLSADSKNKVLLIEAGGEPPLMSRIPAGMPKLFKTSHDWAFQSEPNRACSDRRIFIPRGKMLGGSASMNAQIHQWCHPADFDEWAASGARGWSWEEVRPTFVSMEAIAGPPADGSDSRGFDGPMRVEVPASESVIPRLWVEAARSAGYNGTGAYNGTAFRGAWLTEQAHRGGRRFSVYDAFLKPAMRRPNLKVLTGRLAERIGFRDGRAASVEISGGERHEAARGIILAAGAYGSPQLLMVSGVGPGKHLASRGIEPVLDRPQVGMNLQDHAVAPLVFQLRRPISLKRASSPIALLRWLLFRKGLLATSGIDAFAFESTTGTGPPDLELILVPFEARSEFLEDPRKEAFSVGSAVLKPRSRGTVSLRSPSMADPPVIDLNLLSDPGGADRKVLLAGARLARAIAATEPMAAECIAELPPTAGIDDDGEPLSAMIPSLQTVYHPAGTCRMGMDDEAVVDECLRVKGTEGLWVIDASVMPSVPRGHPNAVVAMIAQRAAGMNW